MQTVLITGAAKGIGRETARLFARNGYNVLINYNRSKRLANELCSSLNNEGFNTDVFKADVSIRSEVNKEDAYNSDNGGVKWGIVVKFC
jgi:3-oxoacyl-[acyl-carrier protein] reductase